MIDAHPARNLLERFVLGRLPAVEMRRISRHLLGGCAECQQLTAGFAVESGGETRSESREDAGGPSEADREPQDTLFERAVDRVYRLVTERALDVEKERAAARELSEELLRHPFARQLLLVGNSPRFHTRMLCENLLERCFDAGFREPAQAIDLARLAVAVAERLDGNRCGGRESWNGLRARAHAHLGNALRINADLAGANRALEEAAAIVEEGRVPPFDAARVLDLLASLRRDQRRLEEAGRLLDRVLTLYRRLGQRHLIGRTLKQKSMVYAEMGDLETEIALLQQALGLLDVETDLRTVLAARHNLISALCESGRPREAFAMLFHTRPLYLKTGDRMSLIRLRWLEGAVARGLERFEQAAVAFREVHAAFLDLGLEYDAAIAALDLASIHARQGRTREVLRLVEDMLASFRARNIHREAVAAVQTLQRAAEREQAGAFLCLDVADYLKQARSCPELRYTPKV
jgi:tetratricopeptide (TPR) repeat protein